MCFQIGCIEATRAKIRFVHDLLHKWNGRFDAAQHVLFERPVHAAHGLIPGAAPDRQFGQQRIVIRGDGIVLIDGAVDADADASGDKYAVTVPVEGLKLFCGSSALIRH